MKATPWSAKPTETLLGNGTVSVQGTGTETTAPATTSLRLK